jgi:hypothetical protein
MELDRDAARARLLTEVRERISAWNALPFEQRFRLLRAALPAEASAFVAHSNALEGVPTLSAAETYEMVKQTAEVALDPAAFRATMNTYEAFRLARAFRLDRAASGIGAADELLWHVPQVLAVHRALMSGLHQRPGRLRNINARPSDRKALYVPAAAVRSTLWSFFDVANGRALQVFGENASDGDSGKEEEEPSVLGVLDEDDAICEEECVRLLAGASLGPDVRDIDERVLLGVVQHAAWFAAHFLEVHPFGDGNGRLTRILIDALLACVHPVPVPLIPADSSLEEARFRYLSALREVPPWAEHNGASWAKAAPVDLSDLILESLAASWRRLASVQENLFGGGKGPFLGVLVLSLRSSVSTRRSRYMLLGHHERTHVPSVVELDSEVDALPLPPSSVVLLVGSPSFLLYTPTGRAEDGWCSVGWVL